MDGMTTYYNNYPITQAYEFPFMGTEWNPIVSSVYTTPILPVTVISPQMITPVICPYTGALVTEPIVQVIPPITLDVSPVICNKLCNQVYETEVYSEKSVSTDNLSENIQYITEEDDEIEEVDMSKNDETFANHIEHYLRLPKELFPTPKMLSIDPNLIIDEFCKLDSVRENVSWILDLEFGVPSVPVTRIIAAYDVKFNSVHCKNTPGAIHPGFEKCNKDFKRAILFYYDCVISNWYNGYIVLSYDKSVENFQSWLQTPMRIFGMCWT